MISASTDGPKHPQPVFSNTCSNENRCFPNWSWPGPLPSKSPSYFSIQGISAYLEDWDKRLGSLFTEYNSFKATKVLTVPMTRKRHRITQIHQPVAPVAVDKKHKRKTRQCQNWRKQMWSTLGACTSHSNVDALGTQRLIWTVSHSILKSIPRTREETVPFCP